MGEGILELINVKTALEILGVSYNTFQEYIDLGIIKVDLYTPGGNRRFRRDQIENIFKKPKTPNIEDEKYP